MDGLASAGCGSAGLTLATSAGDFSDGSSSDVSVNAAVTIGCGSGSAVGLASASITGAMAATTSALLTAIGCVVAELTSAARTGARRLTIGACLLYTSDAAD